MEAIYSFALLALTSFFTIMNPVGTMPIFMSMTAELDQPKRKITARKAVIVAFFTVLFFAFTGQLLFRFFGISVNSFRVVGGIIFFLIGQDMLHARLGAIKFSGSESEINAYVNDISVTPLGIPMICGPGAITNGIVLMEDANTAGKKIVLVISVAIVLLLTYIILVGSAKISKKLGDTGNKVLMRLMGLIVMVIAVEFFFTGLKPIIVDIIHAAK
ncbi:MAG: NAAT family transporter [Bacteroidales bacterium]|nr:NAAT family transporter [Bacteroidales bacterium]